MGYLGKPVLDKPEVTVFSIFFFTLQGNKFLNLSAIDPIGRYAPLATVNAVRLKRSIFKISPYRDVIIQVALIAETKR